jgi:hypothetical protein
MPIYVQKYQFIIIKYTNTSLFNKYLTKRVQIRGKNTLPLHSLKK